MSSPTASWMPRPRAVVGGKRHQEGRVRPDHSHAGLRLLDGPARPAQLLALLGCVDRYHPRPRRRQIPRPVDGARSDRDQRARDGPRRFGEHTVPDVFAVDKAIEEYHLMYATRPPGEHHPAARKQKTSPLYARLDAKGAQWEEVYGWERPQYFGEPGVRTFKRSNAFPIVAAGSTGEHARRHRRSHGVRQIRSHGRRCCNAARPGQRQQDPGYGRWPAPRAHAHRTRRYRVRDDDHRLGEGRYYLNSAIMATTHDEDWLNHHILDGEDVTVHQRHRSAASWPSPALAAVMCSRRTDADLHAPAFRWLTARGDHRRRCGSRRCASYVGELGWEFTWPSRTCPPSTARWWPPVSRTDWCTSARTP